MRPGPLGTRRGIVAGLGVALLSIVAIGGYAVTSVDSAAARTQLLLVLGVSVVSVGGFGTAVVYGTVVPASRLRKRAESLDEGDLDAEFQSDAPGAFGEIADRLESVAERLEAAEADREEAVAEAERLERRLDSMEGTAEEYASVVRDCSAGEFTHRMDPEAESEALEALASEFNGLIDELEYTLDQLELFTADVARSSESVTESAASVRSASEQVARSIQKINEGTERQHENLKAASVEMNALSTTTEEIASSSDEVADLAERTAQAGERGREAAHEAVSGLDRIETVTVDAVDQMERLTDEMGTIDDLAEVIADLAEKTNVLALNANIEVSRAGSDGDSDGFGVVASEIKELADETKDAAGSIETQLQEVQAKTEAAADSVREAGDQVDDNAESVRNAIDALEEVAEYAQETNAGVQDISTATEQQATSAEEVVAMVEEATTISERTSRETRNVATAAREQTEAISRVSNNVDELSTEANRVLDALSFERVDQPRPDRELSSTPAEDASSGEDGMQGTPAVETGIGENATLDAYELKQAVVEAYPGDEPPWHAIARIQLMTDVDLENAEPGEEVPPAKQEAVVEAAEQVTGSELDVSPQPTTGEDPDGEYADNLESMVSSVLDESGSGSSDPTGEVSPAAAGGALDGTGSLDAYELKQAVVEAYPGDEPPWHALARIQLKTDVDLEDVEPGEEVPPAKQEAVVEAAEAVTGTELDVSPGGPTPASATDSTTDPGGDSRESGADSVVSAVVGEPARESGSPDPSATGSSEEPASVAGSGTDETASLDAYELKEAVVGAYPGDEPPWHALARIQLKTDVDLEGAEPGEEVPPDKHRAVVEAAEEVTGQPIDVGSDRSGTDAGIDWETPAVASGDGAGAGGSPPPTDPDATRDAYELKEAIVAAYPGDEPPWHAIARIQLKTNYDLENVEPGETVSEEQFEELVTAAREVTGSEIDV